MRRGSLLPGLRTLSLAGSLLFLGGCLIPFPFPSDPNYPRPDPAAIKVGSAYLDRPLVGDEWLAEQEANAQRLRSALENWPEIDRGRLADACRQIVASEDHRDVTRGGGGVGFQAGVANACFTHPRALLSYIDSLVENYRERMSDTGVRP